MIIINILRVMKVCYMTILMSMVTHTISNSKEPCLATCITESITVITMVIIIIPTTSLDIAHIITITMVGELGHMPNQALRPSNHPHTLHLHRLDMVTQNQAVINQLQRKALRKKRNYHQEQSLVSLSDQ